MKTIIILINNFIIIKKKCVTVFIYFNILNDAYIYIYIYIMYTFIFISIQIKNKNLILPIIQKY
jgi:hypothetical protein